MTAVPAAGLAGGPQRCGLGRHGVRGGGAQQLQDLGGEFRKGHKHYIAKLKGQTIEEYKPDLTFNSGPSGSGGGGGFFDDDEEKGAAGGGDPRFSAAQTLQLVMAERMTEEREKAITKVAESVKGKLTREREKREMRRERRRRT